MCPATSQNVAIELSAVIVAVTGHEPQIMVLPGRALPSGSFGTQHRTLDQGLRAWVEAQSGLKLGYVEQLYTFADRDRTFFPPARSAVPATARTKGIMLFEKYNAL